MAIEVTRRRRGCIEILYPQLAPGPPLEGHPFRDYPPMTLVTFLSYLLKFFSNQALLTALIALIQRLLNK
jgi:hypothetical protein